MIMKNILWIVNIPFADAPSLFNLSKTPYGGWLLGYLKETRNDNKITVAFPLKNRAVSDFKFKDGVSYVSFPFNLSRQKVNSILDKVQPDVIHLHGTEFKYSYLFFIEAKRRNINVVVSIQGLVSEYSKYLSADLPLRVVYGSSIRNLLNQDAVYQISKSFRKRGKNEIQILNNSDVVIGRTDWDYAVTRYVAKNDKYQHVEEILRSEFYFHKWNYISGNNTIYISQATYPIKGTHYFLKALFLLKAKIPDIVAYIGGKNIMKCDSLKDKLLQTKYSKYIKKLIRIYDLEKNVIFLGPRNANEVAELLSKVSVFVSPSSIENSSNSIAEAMLVGTPIVASDVGGTNSLIKHNENGLLYQHNSEVMLALLIEKIFNDKDLSQRLSNHARETALYRHNAQTAGSKINDIYKNFPTIKL